MRIALAVFVILAVAILFTVAFVLFLTRGTAATGLRLVWAVTVLNPIYWAMVVLIIAVSGWLFRGWFLHKQG